MIVTIQRNENEFMTVDLAKVDDDDIADEARERDYIVLEKEPFNILYNKLNREQDITQEVKELIYNTLGRIL
jgi:hypothetical protein